MHQTPSPHRPHPLRRRRSPLSILLALPLLFAVAVPAAAAETAAREQPGPKVKKYEERGSRSGRQASRRGSERRADRRDDDGRSGSRNRGARADRRDTRRSQPRADDRRDEGRRSQPRADDRHRERRRDSHVDRRRDHRRHSPRVEPRRDQRRHTPRVDHRRDSRRHHRGTVRYQRPRSDYWGWYPGHSNHRTYRSYRHSHRPSLFIYLDLFGLDHDPYSCHRHSHHRYGYYDHPYYSAFEVPRYIDDYDYYDPYYYDDVYYSDHRHDHRVYRFPVYEQGRWIHRPYAYCGGRLVSGGHFTSSGPRFTLVFDF